MEYTILISLILFLFLIKVRWKSITVNIIKEQQYYNEKINDGDYDKLEDDIIKLKKKSIL